MFKRRSFTLSALTVMILGLSACSTPPAPPFEETNEAQQEMTPQETTPAVVNRPDNGVVIGEREDSGVIIGGVDLPVDQEPRYIPNEQAGLIDDFATKEVSATYGNVVYFAFDDYALDDEAMKVVQHFANYLIANPEKDVVLEGHTDERGTPEYNLALGENRAKSVADTLKLLGIEADRITANTFGETYPINLGHNEAAWQQNRRVEISILHGNRIQIVD